MLERVFRDPRVLERLRRGPLGVALDDLAGYLNARGHALTTVQTYVRAAGHLSYWLGAQRIPLALLSEETVRDFLHRHLPKCRCRVPFGAPLTGLRAVLRHLLIVLRRSGQIAPAPLPEAKPAEALVEAFQSHLRATRGATSKTCTEYGRYVCEFLDYGDVTDPRDVARLDVRDVMDFVAGRAARCKPKTAQLVATALRSFLRFQQMLGRCDRRLAAAVPTIPRRRLSQIPRVLTDDQLGALLGSFDRSKGVGKRDYAMTLCMVQLGLRAGEVARLSLDDFDWRSGTVQIGTSKVRRASILPLPSPVGRAIVAYLRRGRPATNERRVFVRHSLPFGAPIGPGVVRAAVRNGFVRADVRVASRGTYVLRHTAATRLIRAGATLKEVADILRHRSFDTTMIYTKVDLPRLTEVALEFPKGHL